MRSISATDARTLLFVPADRPERFDKAAAAGADGIILDLEDAVGSDRKVEARAAVSSWLRQGGNGIVRINPPHGPWFEADLDALRGKPRTVMLPKASPAAAAEVMRRLGPESRIIALIETAAGVMNARAIAATAGVSRLALGNLDLSVELAVDPNNHLALLTARTSLVLASAAVGVASPIDGVTTVLDDPSTLGQDVRHAVSLGFTGKLCIHPSQIGPAHEALMPTSDQIQRAERIIAAAKDGALIVLDGNMLDKPVIDRARRILRLARLGGPGVPSTNQADPSASTD